MDSAAFNLSAVTFCGGLLGTRVKAKAKHVSTIIENFYPEKNDD